MRYTGNILAVSRIPIPEVFQDSRHGQVAGIHIQIPLPFRLCALGMNGHVSPGFRGVKKRRLPFWGRRRLLFDGSFVDDFSIG